MRFCLPLILFLNRGLGLEGFCSDLRSLRESEILWLCLSVYNRVLTAFPLVFEDVDAGLRVAIRAAQYDTVVAVGHCAVGRGCDP